MITKASIGAMLLVTGCCIGAGMIGLPVLSAQAGLIPTTVAMLGIYLFTTLTGLLLLEAALWFDRPVNLMSIASSAFGRAGKLAAMLLFLFLFYCLFVAYFDGGGQLFADALTSLTHHTFSKNIGIFLFLGVIISITYGGTRRVDKVNRILLFLMVSTYIILVLAAIPQINVVNLTHQNFYASLFTIPVLMICFGYQNLVPSLVTYLKRDVAQCRFAIIAGNFIPFIIYTIWNIVILGMIPLADIHAASSADLVTQMLSESTHAASVIFALKMFSFFAILTPILPITLSFVDFLRDGIVIGKRAHAESKLPYYAMVVIPPLFFTLLYPNLFLEALSFAGGFIDVLLFGVIPALVVLQGRKMHTNAPYRVLGGRFTPYLVLILCASILFIKHLSAG